jgi:hypothetical protein
LVVRTAIGLTLVLSVSACAPESSPGIETAPTPYQEVADIRQLMLAVIEPAAEVYWDSVGTIMDMEGTEEIAPRTNEEWTAVRNAAMVVAESGNLLLMPKRALDDAQWTELSLELIASARLALIAAEARDPIAVFEAGGDLYLICSDCHATFAPDTLRPSFQPDS